MKLALALMLVGTTAVSAAPTYVGQNMNAPNNITLNFQDTPIKGQAGADDGNIAAIALKAAYNPLEYVAIRTDLPFFFATKDATGTKSRNALGNYSLGAGFQNTYAAPSKEWSYGYNLSADVYAPTSRKIEANTVALANPTTDFYRYLPKATSITPTVGVFAMGSMWSAKINAGYGWSYLPKSTATQINGVTSQSRNTFTWQTAASWHALPYLSGNLEYNTIILSGDAKKTGLKNTAYRHAIVPSISGNMDNLMASAYVTVPLDSATRDSNNVAFGLNAGYTF